MSKTKQSLFQKRRLRVRNKLKTIKGRLRLSVHCSNKNIMAQIIDDHQGHTLVAVSSLEPALGFVGKNNVKAASELGTVLSQRAKEKGLTKCYFDRGGFLFHGKVKALADAARAGGLQF